MANKGLERQPALGSKHAAQAGKMPHDGAAPARIDFGAPIDLPPIGRHPAPKPPSHYVPGSHHGPALKTPPPVNKPDAPKPLTYTDLDKEFLSRARQAGHVAFGWQVPVLALIIFGVIGGAIGFVFGSRIDAAFLGICFGIAGTLVARMASRAHYRAWEGFIPGFLFGAGFMLAIDLAFRQNLSAFWFIAGAAIGAALDFYFRRKIPPLK